MIIIAGLILIASNAFAAIVKLKDGSTLEGDIISFDGATLIFNSNSLGELTIDADRIRAIETDDDADETVESPPIIPEEEATYSPTQSHYTENYYEESYQQEYYYEEDYYDKDYEFHQTLLDIPPYYSDFQTFIEHTMEESLYFNLHPKAHIGISSGLITYFTGMLTNGLFMYGQEEYPDINYFFYEWGIFFSHAIFVPTMIITLVYVDFGYEDGILLDTFTLLGIANGLATGVSATDDFNIKTNPALQGVTLIGTLLGVGASALMIYYTDTYPGTMNLVQSTTVFSGFLGFSLASYIGLFEDRNDVPVKERNYPGAVWMGVGMMDLALIVSMVLLYDTEISVSRSEYINLGAVAGGLGGLGISYAAGWDFYGEKLFSTSIGLTLGYIATFLLTINYDETLKMEAINDYFGFPQDTISLSTPSLEYQALNQSTSELVFHLPSIQCKF